MGILVHRDRKSFCELVILGIRRAKSYVLHPWESASMGVVEWHTGRVLDLDTSWPRVSWMTRPHISVLSQILSTGPAQKTQSLPSAYTGHAIVWTPEQSVTESCSAIVSIEEYLGTTPLHASSSPKIT